MTRNLVISILATIVLSFSPVFSADDIPSFSQPVVPDLYLINPGDELIVTFVQLNIDSLILRVNPEGKVVHRTLGVFDLSGNTLAAARDILQPAIYRLYKVDQAEISITKPIMVTINITGAVWRPGSYEGYTSERVSDIINRAGGIITDGSRRRISFFGGGNSIKVDLEKSDFTGDLTADPCLYAGLNIFVNNRSENVVQVTGEVNQPKDIELLPEDDIDILISLAGGIRSSGDSSSVYIIRKNQKLSDLSMILAGDIIVVPPYRDDEKLNKIGLFGAVVSPGYYDYSENLSLNDLVRNAGGYQSDASRDLVTVFRKPRLDYSGRVTHLRYPISNSFDNPNNGEVHLKAFDSVFVPVKVGYVRVSGEVLNPGYYSYTPSKKAGYYIANAGGFLPTANSTEILFYNPVSKISSTISTGVEIPDGGELVIQKKEELK